MTTTDATPGDTQAVIDFAAAATFTAPEWLDDGRIASILVPPGYTRHEVDLTKRLDKEPPRKIGADTVHDTDSFLKLLRRHQGADTVVYVDPENMRALAVFNDHSSDVAGWRDHRLTCQWKATPGWKRWSQVHRQLLDQDDFAELVEDGLTEILAPSGADLLELAQSIKASTNAQFRSDRRLANGQVQFAYHEQIEASAGADGTMTIPSHIQLLLAPIQGAEPQTVTARLRYRLAGGKLKLGVIIDQLDQLLLDAVAREVYKIEQEAHGAPVVTGTLSGGWS